MGSILRGSTLRDDRTDGLWVEASGLALAAVFAAHALTSPLLANVGADSPTNSEPSMSAQALSPSAPISGGERAPGREFVGRWVSENPTNPAAFLEVSEHGLWFASDGCNQSDGWWRIGPDGKLDTAGGAMTEIGCTNDVTITAIVTARDAEVAEELLVLTDAAGVSSRFTRIDDHAITLTGGWIGPGELDESAFVTFAADGSWQATTGCTESSGTWELGPMPLSVVPQQGDPDVAVFAASAPGLLRTGSVTTKAATGCAKAEPEALVPFRADTDYAFTFRLGGSDALETFSIAPVAVAGEADPAPSAREFTRFSVAAG